MDYIRPEGSEMLDMSSSIYMPKRDDTKAAANVLAEAFIDYPLYVYTLPNAATRLRSLQTIFEVEITYAHKYGRIYATSPNLEGVMYCLPKEERRISNWKMVKSGAMKVPLKIGRDFVKRQAPITKVHEKLRAKHANFPHTYLWNIGVKPEYQHNKCSSKLIQYLLSDLSERNESCYLETAVEINVSIYQHFGFEIMETVGFPDLNYTVWAMLWRNTRDKLNRK